ncbi:WD40 repeat domain-containing protein [Komagataeibacter oboediens]|uniref:WD40 repeat domain-containing protein n=1 Tax=Komagataeibacter oboediens TaxID=65958 RepID=UPI001C2C511A|nr:WD40 repeat domain-containing protein [Komagataeibacter oboediens]MBV0887091.1 WD40 repeat domain-containing protein [Komagataeibacter oboediens]MCK9819537.1 WD40 repeat domain-containing protein [Komagataeibacter oboediens]WEQ53370.1 WD40 repeat domain-containing protein [Komagataeibacter oboediens]
MSDTVNDTIPPTGLLERRGAMRQLEGQITGCTVSRDSQQVAFATGEGDIMVADRSDWGQSDAWTVTTVHDGAILAIAPDAGPTGFLTGGDDSALRRIAADGSVSDLVKGRRWIEHITTWSSGKGGVIAFASGRQVELRDADGHTTLKVLDHPSTVSGIVFDAKGKRIAASHYNGASMWFVQAKVDTVRPLEWKGSHIGIAIHPAGEALVTSMQESELHGWRLADGHNMRMSGYPSKVQSMAFTRNGKWLVTSGADTIVMWPFFGGGPMGKPPAEAGGLPGVMCTRVACHPVHDIVAAGFADGSVLMADTGAQRILPVCIGGSGPVTALEFSPDGCCLAFGSEDGRACVVDLSAK